MCSSRICRNSYLKCVCAHIEVCNEILCIKEMNKAPNLQSKPQLGHKPGSVKVVRALYNYTAKYPDELSFIEGDILYVFEKSNSDWWKARLGSKSGLIPSNYVEGKFNEIVNPLHEAARRGNLSFLQECIAQKVSPTALDSMGNTALYWASNSGHLDCLKYLLSIPNPPLNAQNHFGDTPLHGAAARNHFDVVQILLEAGCDPNISNNNGETPEKLAGTQQIKNILHQFNLCSLKLTSASPEEYEDDSD